MGGGVPAGFYMQRTISPLRWSGDFQESYCDYSNNVESTGPHHIAHSYSNKS